ncbi:MAG TPA: alpha/beta fold hydrolase [Polyangiaceae bacterium]|nr:alpha/beta fold hydrolase [Polyangiaceae bacterium]
MSAALARRARAHPRGRRTARRATPLVCGALLGLGCAGGQTSDRSITLEPCRLDGLGVEARCGIHRVYENRETRQGRSIDLRIAVVPALAASPRPDPLIVIVGGPGQAATVAGAPLAEALREVRNRRDIVLVDQRGTGKSNPLTCEADREQPLEELFAPRPDLAKTRACLDALDADTRLYATPAAMDDLDEVREALGYERVNLWGGSYGTRAALVYLRQHPEHVRSLVLDGVAPFSLKLPLYAARDAQRALDLTYADCQGDPDCRATFPDARAELDRLLASLDPTPLEATVAHPRTGAPTRLRIERAGLAGAVRNLLYLPQLAGLLPLAVQRARGGDFGAFISSADAFAHGVGVATGMFLSIVCAEDVPRFDANDVEAATRGTFMGGAWLGDMRAECQNWPSAQLPDAYHEPIASDVPSLLLSGNLDPVTPPSWGDEVASRLSHSRHIVVPGAGHGTTTLGCIPDLLAEFLETLDAAALDTTCVQRLRRPAFFTSLQGPSP